MINIEAINQPDYFFDPGPRKKICLNGNDICRRGIFGGSGRRDNDRLNYEDLVLIWKAEDRAIDELRKWLRENSPEKAEELEDKVNARTQETYIKMKNDGEIPRRQDAAYRKLIWRNHAVAILTFWRAIDDLVGPQFTKLLVEQCKEIQEIISRKKGNHVIPYPDKPY